MQYFYANHTAPTQGRRSRKKETPSQNFFVGNPARLLPLGGGNLRNRPPLPVDRGTLGDGFGIFTNEKAAPRFVWEFSLPLMKHGKHERKRWKRW